MEDRHRVPARRPDLRGRRLTSEASEPGAGWSPVPGFAVDNVKVLFHSNAPWTPSGCGQQAALFAPRLAEHVELTISAFHGLQGARVRWEGIDVYPSVGGTYGDE